jgi:hypothetical protein
MTPSIAARTTTLARFPANLNLPEPQQSLVKEAAEAVRQEYRSSVQWKRLRCRKVQPLTTDPDQNIYVLDVGHALEFDWTWEGALAFRPQDPDQVAGDTILTDDFIGSPASEGAGNGRRGVWAGEVVEVDETKGRLFVSVGGTGSQPCCGTFFVRPFEFLVFLYSLFCRPEGDGLKKLLPARLNASRGDVHPAAAGPYSGLKEFERLWGHSWGVLWGPPGCGKTTNVGRQVAACLGDAGRTLVVSTTNKATDAAALAIGRGASQQSVEEGRILRIGKGADHEAYEAERLLALLRGTETELLREIGSLTRQLERTPSHEDRAVLRQQVQELRRGMKDSAFNIFVSPEVKVVIATAFKAVTLLCDPAIRSLVEAGEAPFTTVVIDEAGLMSRAVVAGMSLLASRRVVAVGDAKQLAPISKVSRVLPTSQAVWLASSSLTHLQRVGQVGPGVHMLREQHRMHPQVSKLVSHYHYEGALCDAPTVSTRQAVLPPLLAKQPRAIWYVLDEDGHDLPSIRAERGPGNLSWVRPATREVLRKLFSDPEVRKARGLFITPFRAQAREIAGYFAAEHLDGWSAGTVHGRQGTEADIVVFDTVNAGSCGWPYDEWKRLVNVGLSRAREFVLLLASRAEMNEPYLRPLVDNLAPRVLRRSGRGMAWVEAKALVVVQPDPQIAANPALFGHQIERRKALRPVMSAEQQRLCGYRMDGKPRLVRGVAGSGKTLVLAHWLQRTMQNLADKADARVWAVYANRSLHRLIADTIEDAWRAAGVGGQVPWDRVKLAHVRDILGLLLPKVGLHMRGNDFDYDAMAAQYLQRVPFEELQPCCQALFVDEAQDMGPNTLRLLSALVEQADPDDPKSRAVNIFYDNAQNIFGRATPRWSEIGLDMRGRSTVMKESFRSTRPVAEFALNVLYRLRPPEDDPDHKELVERGLVEATRRDGEPWWSVRFNQIDGPLPDLRVYETMESQIEALTGQLVRWIREEGVKPGDICILYNGSNIPYHLDRIARPALEGVGARLIEMSGPGVDRPEDAVVYSTSHSFKGYEAEVVVIPSVEQFIAKDKGILANTLYVAMTRARSLLVLYGYARRANSGKDAQLKAALLRTVKGCLDTLVETPPVEQQISNIDDFEGLLGQLGPDFRDWLGKLWKSYLIQQEPMKAEDGEILAEPLFWFQVDDQRFACFGDAAPRATTRHKLEDAGIKVVRPGDTPE